MLQMGLIPACSYRELGPRPHPAHRRWQGAAQGFEDAYILARWLAALPDDPVAAMENFRRVRIPRVHAVQRCSAAIVRAKHDYELSGENTARAKVDAVDAMAWIWGFDAVANWDRAPAVPAVA